jgi:hypothetical protein
MQEAGRQSTRVTFQQKSTSETHVSIIHSIAIASTGEG